MGGVKVGRLFAELNLDKKGFESGLKSVSGGFNSLLGVAKKAAIGIGAALVGVGVAAAKMAVDFEAQMANVHTLIGPGSETDARIASLGEDVKAMSVETGKSLEDLTGGLYQVISAFGDTADTSGILEVAAKASKAGLAETTDAVNLLSAVTKGYGDTSVGAVQKVSDLAFQTVKLGQTTFPELASAMGKVIPVANTMGVTQEELFGAMATLTGVTGDTSEVVTQLQSSMIGLLKPNKNMTAALEELGYTGAQAGKDLISKEGLVGAMNLIQGSSEATKVGLGKLFRNAEALPAIFALTGSQADVFATKLSAMNDAAGETSKAFEIQENTVAGTFDKVKAAIGVLLVNIGEKLLPVLRDVLDWVVAHWGEISKAISDVFDFIGGVISFFVENILPPLVSAFQFIVDNVIPPIVDAFSSSVPGAMDVLGGVFGWISDELIPALGAAFTWIVENVVPPFQAVIGAIVSWFQENWPLISELLDDMADAFGAAFEYASAIIGAVWPGIEAVAKVLFPILGQAAQVLFKAIDYAFKLIAGVFKAITPIAKAMVDALVTVFNALIGPVKAVWDGVTSAIKGAVNGVIWVINKFIGFLNGLHIHIPGIDIPFVGKVGDFDVGIPHIPTIPFLASGVQGFGGGMAIVGERGPELVNLPSGSDVLSNSQLAAALATRAGGDTHIRINIENFTGSDRDIDRFADRLALRLQLAGNV